MRIEPDYATLNMTLNGQCTRPVERGIAVALPPGRDTRVLANYPGSGIGEIVTREAESCGEETT